MELLVIRLKYNLMITLAFLGCYCHCSQHHMGLIDCNSVHNGCLDTSKQGSIIWKKCELFLLFSIWKRGRTAPLGNINSKQCNDGLLGNSSAVQRRLLFWGGLRLAFVSFFCWLKCAVPRNTKDHTSEILPVFLNAFQAPGEAQTHRHAQEHCI